MTPHPHQRAAVDDVKAHICAGRAPVLVSPTGSGKSFMGSLIVRELDVPTLWLAHRKELVDQACEELRGLGLDPTALMPGRPFYRNRMVWVASVQTAARRILDGRRLVIIDECHHAPSSNFRRALTNQHGAMIAGLTATPFRLDGRPLGDVFDRLVVAAYPDDLVSQGYLVEPKVYAPPAAAIGDLKVERSGDYNRGKLAKRIDKPKLVGDVVQTWRTHAEGYRTIVFAWGVEHSQHLAAEFRAAGVAAEHVDADTQTDERRAVLDRFRRGETTLLSNVELFTEGFNLPAVECVVLDRLTASLCLFLQMVGRSMRISQGKRHPIVLDHAGNFLRHGRVTRRLEYSLTGRPKFAQQNVGLRSCPRCFRIVLSSRPRCPECGLAFATVAEPRGMPDRIGGVLQMYTAEQLDIAARTPEEIAAIEAEEKRKANDRIWWQLTAVARKRGLHRGWISKQYELQTGHKRTIREVEWDAPAAIAAAAESDLFAEAGRAIA